MTQIDKYENVALIIISTYDVELFFVHLRDMCHGNNSTENVISKI